MASLTMAISQQKGQGPIQCSVHEAEHPMSQLIFHLHWNPKEASPNTNEGMPQ